ncbi:MAG: SDR family oxidoreductase [Pseudomonadota bacterium]
MTTILVTGANRGIGLEFVRQYAAAGVAVLAVCRSPNAATDLRALTDGAAVELFAADVSDPTDVAALNSALDRRTIDILINNAGVDGRRAATFNAMDYDAFAQTLAVNTISPVRIIDALRQRINAGGTGRIINISSNLGGIGQAGGGHYAYRASKAALNMATKAIAEDLRGAAIVAAFHPGWVQTDMGGASAPLSAEKSVAGMRAAIEALTPDDSGGFFNYDGARLPY